jgi:periplasmic divalent cation tolerance protein
MGFIIVYITHKNMNEAKKVADYLLKKRLIACVNYFPIKSAYWWKRKITNSKEIVSLVKTKRENWNKIKEEIKKIHPYETPCVMKLNVEANEDYEKWIEDETKLK